MPDTFREDWLERIQEEIVDPAREIVDAHHHLFTERSEISPPYSVEDLLRDTATHRVGRTVFVQCFERYRESGPEHLRPVGETEWVDSVAAGISEGSRIAAIVGHADLRLGDRAEEVIEAHEAASELFRGIRMAAAWDESDELFSIPDLPGPDLYDDPDFRAGLGRLTRRGHSFDAYQYFHQLPCLARLARDFPDTTIVLDHVGTPLGIGPYVGRDEEISRQWRSSITELARCPNVVVKLGGLLMPWVGMGFENGARPPTSDEIQRAQLPWFTHAVDAFGADRCMFESNFPVDKYSASFAVLWNSFKKLASECSETEKDAMFRGTATRVYRLDTGELR